MDSSTSASVSMSPSSGFMTPASISHDELETLTFQYYKESWDEALEICRDSLHPKSISDLEHLDTCERLIEDITEKHAAHKNRTVPRLIRRLEPALRLFGRFTDVVVPVLTTRGNYLATAAIWAIIRLLIEASLTSMVVLTNIVEMVEEFSHKLDVLRMYLPVGIIPGPNDSIKRAVVEVLVDIITFWAKTVSTLSKNPIASAMKNVWDWSISGEMKQTSDRVQRNIDKIKETANAMMYRKQFLSQQMPSQAEILRSFEKLRTKDIKNEDRVQGDDDPPQTSEQSALKCHHILFPENSLFFQREDLLATMRAELTHQPDDPRHRSMVIWGIGGVGKTQLALSYAYERKKQGLRIILWMNAETRDTLLQACTEIAVRMKLAGVVEAGQHERNQGLLVKWLRETNTEFLMIFDNVENIDEISDTWVDSPHGSILVTTRYEFISLLPIQVTIHIPSMDEEQGSRFLLNIARQDDASEDNTDSAKELSELLGGLPLAMTIMAMQVRRRRMSLASFVSFYKHNEARLHRPDKKISLQPFYSYDLSTAYRLSFQSLEEPSTALLQIISVINPDEIPMQLFHAGDIANLPSTLSFCSESWEFEEAIDSLTSSSLVWRDPSKNTISIHRVIQLEFRNTLDNETRKQALKSGSKLLLEAFPKQVNGQSLRNEWTRCIMFIQHVLSLIQHFEAFEMPLSYSGEFVELAECLSNVSWYLMESGSWSRCEKVLETAFRICDDKQSILYAHLLNTAAYLRDKRNRSKEALDLYKQSKKIREEKLGPVHEELANTHNNMGLALESCCRPQEALNCYMRALEIDMLKPEGERNKILHIRHLNIGSAYASMGDFEKAQENVEMGRQFAIRTFGKDTYYESIADYQLSEVSYRKGDFDEAKYRLNRALVIQREQNKLHPTTGATLFKLGCIELKEGLVELAGAHLDEALLIAQYNVPQKGDQGDVARVQRRLAELRFLQGRRDDGQRLFELAEGARKDIQGDDWESLGDSEHSYNLLVSCYYR